MRQLNSTTERCSWHYSHRKPMAKSSCFPARRNQKFLMLNQRLEKRERRDQVLYYVLELEVCGSSSAQRRASNKFVRAPRREPFASGDLVGSSCLIASHKISRCGECEPSSMKQTLSSSFPAINGMLKWGWRLPWSEASETSSV